ncbi:MAG TPA: chitosanase [Phototrophicaceae bacterium]|jgi:hypothetical protein|nr:chitosanase [Phototrophicaceae bacterium]
MSSQPCKAKIRGIPNIPSVTEVNVRSGPSTAQQLLFKIPVGTMDLAVLDVQPDSTGAALNNKVYQWFKLSFPNGQNGWVRDDLAEIVGDCAVQGYGVLTEYTFAFDRTRSTGSSSGTATTTPPTTIPPVTTTPPASTTTPPATGASGSTSSSPNSMDDPIRVRKAAFAVTAAFEGHGYAAYQNYDRGIISYGRFQFALNGGLGSVVERYLNRSNTDVANQMRPYLPRIKAVDESLRSDTHLRDLLIAAAAEPVMQAVQDEVATENYWNRIMDLSINPRGIQSPLAKAMLFDIGIQYGVMHQLIGLAEQDLGVAPKSRVGENGITEKQLIAQVAERRRRGLYAQAERDNLPGLKPRADLWVNLIAANDWGFQGDVSGNVNASGKIIQVRNP